MFDSLRPNLNAELRSATCYLRANLRLVFDLRRGGHLLLPGGMSLYIVVAIRHEERDLVALYGETYEEFRTKVGTLIPRLMRSRSRT